MLLSILTITLSGAVPAYTIREPADAAPAVTAQTRFERSVQRVGEWVAHELGETEPLSAGVVVLGHDAFVERAGELRSWEPGFAAAWDPERQQIVVNDDMFEMIAGALSRDGFFADDAAGLLLAQQLVHVAHERRLGPLPAIDQAADEAGEAAAVRRAMRLGHGLLLQNRYARWVDGEKLEKATRALIASPGAPAGVQAAIAGEAFLARIHERSGAEGVWAALASPPADIAALVRGSADAPPDAASLSELLVEIAGPGEWTPVARTGIAQAVGSAWGWLEPDARKQIEAGIEEAFLSVAIKRGATAPTMISVSVLRFRDQEDAEKAPERLRDAFSLTAMRFDYTPQGEKRDSTPVEREGIEGWRLISGAHPLPGGKAGFGVFGYRVIGRYLVMVNGVSVPEDEAAVAPLLEKIAARFKAH